MRSSVIAKTVKWGLFTGSKREYSDSAKARQILSNAFERMEKSGYTKSDSQREEVVKAAKELGVEPQVAAQAYQSATSSSERSSSDNFPASSAARRRAASQADIDMFGPPKNQQYESDEFQYDDLPSLAHLHLEEHRTAREFIRSAAYELPLLAQYRSEYRKPDVQTANLRFKHFAFLHEANHPAASKVSLTFTPESSGLSGPQLHKLKLLAGRRYDSTKNEVRMGANRFPTQAQNKKYLVQLYERLIASARDDADMFEDVPLDDRHSKKRNAKSSNLRHLKWPEEWSRPDLAPKEKDDIYSVLAQEHLPNAFSLHAAIRQAVCSTSALSIRSLTSTQARVKELITEMPQLLRVGSLTRNASVKGGYLCLNPCASGPSLYLRFRPLSTVPLAFDKWEPRKVSDKHAPIIILHGLFGSKVNNRSVARAMARDLKTSVYCLDLRNHGESPHTDQHNYRSMAEDVGRFIDEQDFDQRPTLIGHSMGAKTAMALALTHPSKLSSVVPVDNGPLSLQLSPDFGRYIEGMIAVDKAKVNQQNEMYQLMKPYCSELPIQQFLLSNFKRNKDDPYHCRLNLPVLAKSLGYMSDFDEFATKDLQYTGPTLLLRGTKSNFVPDECLPLMGQLFPKFIVRDVDSGHWLISEKPNEFIKEVELFLDHDD